MVPVFGAEYDNEVGLVARAQAALSACNWTVGECASLWTQRFAKGRSDADFGGLIGLSGDQVYQRRRVWETFADVRSPQFVGLAWSHYYVALSWDDAAECLQWAAENEATVNEMKAWRRAQHGENLAEPEDSFPPGTVFDRDPSAAEPERPIAGPSNREAAPQAAALARTSPAPVAEETEYAPFSSGARSAVVAPAKSDIDLAEESAERVLLRVCSALEKCSASISPEVIKHFTGVPYTLQERFIKAVDELSALAAGLR